MKSNILIKTAKKIKPKEEGLQEEIGAENQNSFVEWKSAAPKQEKEKKLSKTKVIKAITKTKKIKVAKQHQKVSVQCNGVAKKTGFPCKNITKNASGYCHCHS